MARPLTHRRINMRSATRPNDPEPARRLLDSLRLGTLSPDPWDFPLCPRSRIGGQGDVVERQLVALPLGNPGSRLHASFLLFCGESRVTSSLFIILQGFWGRVGNPGSRLHYSLFCRDSGRVTQELAACIATAEPPAYDRTRPMQTGTRASVPPLAPHKPKPGRKRRGGSARVTVAFSTPELPDASDPAAGRNVLRKRFMGGRFLSRPWPDEASLFERGLAPALPPR